MAEHCPSIEELEALAERDDPEVIAHARECKACQGVLAMVADREADIETPECAEIELLAASGVETNERVREHIALCEGCRLLWTDSLP